MPGDGRNIHRGDNAMVPLLICLGIPTALVVTAYWAHKRYNGKIHMVWLDASTADDDAAIEEVERKRIVRLDINR